MEDSRQQRRALVIAENRLSSCRAMDSASHPAAPAGESGPFGRAAAAVTDLLKHPLVLLSVGAALSGIVVPHLTRASQNHAQELQLKSDLVKEIDKNILPVFHAFRRIEVNHAREKDVLAADRAYVVWFEERDTVSDNMLAYFPHAKKLQAAWDEFVGSVIGAGTLLTEPPGLRLSWIKSHFPREVALLRPLATCTWNCPDFRWHSAFVFLENILHGRKRAALSALLAAHSAL